MPHVLFMFLLNAIQRTNLATPPMSLIEGSEITPLPFHCEGR